jgi:hypothetical protein
MNKFLSKRSIFAFAVILASVMALTYLKARPRLAPGQPPLADISNIKTLQEQFNRDAGQTRLILLVSPT